MERGKLAELVNKVSRVGGGSEGKTEEHAIKRDQIIHSQLLGMFDFYCSLGPKSAVHPV